jgi:hypothetical protein
MSSKKEGFCSTAALSSVMIFSDRMSGLAHHVRHQDDVDETQFTNQDHQCLLSVIKDSSYGGR